MSPEEAFKQSSESITGPITKGISKGGILKLYEGLDKAGQDEFKVCMQETNPPLELERAEGVLCFWLNFVSVGGDGIHDLLFAFRPQQCSAAARR